MGRVVALAAALAVLLAVAMGAAGARAATLLSPDGQPAGRPWQGWIDQAAGRVWLPDVALTLTEGGCPEEGADVLGCAGLDDVWVRVDPWRYRQLARYTLLHELGHVTDYGMGEPRRRQVMELAGWADWYPERFAEAFARCSNPAAIQIAVMRHARRLCALLRTSPPPEVGPAPTWVE